METKYHLRPDGSTGVCHAVLNACPYGGDENHFSDRKSARRAFEEQNNSFTNRQVKDQILEERYFERMAKSMGDKARILKYLPPVTAGANPPKILDVGAGGGEFAKLLQDEGYEVTALDANEDAVDRMLYKYNDLKVVKALANHAHDLGEDLYDSVVCSSILHEVYSYGDDVHRMGHISSLKRATESFYKALKPGGKLLIRDGVKPVNWDDPAEIEMLPGHENHMVQKYLDMCPFSNGKAYGEQGSKIQLTNTGGKKWVGNLQSCMEFAYTYTWGEGSYPRETQELYTPLTLNEYRDLLSETGFEVEESFSYLQEGYPLNLNDKIRLTKNGEPVQWPDSNAVWVARKPLE